MPLWIPVAVHEGYGQTLAASVGCADPATAIACLRGKPVRDLLALTPLPLPGYGNTVLPEDPAAVLAAGPSPGVRPRYRARPHAADATGDGGEPDPAAGRPRRHPRYSK